LRRPKLSTRKFSAWKKKKKSVETYGPLGGLPVSVRNKAYL
jgi:hypothetical protein